MGDNHHVAGLLVLVMGLLASMQGLRWARWTRHWPVIFLGMAGFLLMRNDPEAWPRGPLGFWESLSDPVVFQHRVFVLLIVAFGVFEWSVHLERLRTKGHALVFPLLCAVSGGFLLAHTHSADDLKEQVRLPPPDDRLPGRLWAIGFTLVGFFLLMYRES